MIVYYVVQSGWRIKCKTEETTRVRSLKPEKMNFAENNEQKLKAFSWSEWSFKKSDVNSEKISNQLQI